MLGFFALKGLSVVILKNVRAPFSTELIFCIFSFENKLDNPLTVPGDKSKKFLYM